MLAFFNALPPRLVGMEACTATYHWIRELTIGHELTKLGHGVRLIPGDNLSNVG